MWISHDAVAECMVCKSRSPRAARRHDRSNLPTPSTTCMHVLYPGFWLLPRASTSHVCEFFACLMGQTYQEKSRRPWLFLARPPLHLWSVLPTSQVTGFCFLSSSSMRSMYFCVGNPNLMCQKLARPYSFYVYIFYHLMIAFPERHTPLISLSKIR